MVGQKPSLMTGLAENEGNKDINNKQNNNNKDGDDSSVGIVFAKANFKSL